MRRRRFPNSDRPSDESLISPESEREVAKKAILECVEAEVCRQISVTNSGAVMPTTGLLSRN